LVAASAVASGDGAVGWDANGHISVFATEAAEHKDVLAVLVTGRGGEGGGAVAGKVNVSGASNVHEILTVATTTHATTTYMSSSSYVWCLEIVAARRATRKTKYTSQLLSGAPLSY
jgi:hypothetical protein